MIGAWATIPCEWEKTFLCEMPSGFPFISTNPVIRYFSNNKDLIYILPVVIIISILICIYCCTCTLRKRVRELKSIKLKIPKFKFPFNKKLSHDHMKQLTKSEIQFNCFGPEDSSSEHSDDLHSQIYKPTQIS